MSKYFRDYRWKEGLPMGVDPVEEIATTDTYKIVADPYYKRISVEKYAKGQFLSVMYDSALLDFRHLKKPEQTAWQKIPISDKADKTVCLIRDQNDRVLFIETHFFADQLCRECCVESPQGVLLSKHRMYYTRLGDPFNGVILFDSNQHPVMSKKYEFDEVSQQFTNLLEEKWNGNDVS